MRANSPSMRTSTLVLSLAVVFRKTKCLNLDLGGDYMILGFSFSIKFGFVNDLNLILSWYRVMPVV